MKIAVVVPYLVRLFGSKGALSMAKILSKDNDVEVFVHSLNPQIEESVRSKIGRANLISLEKTDKRGFGKLFALKYQVSKAVDRKIFKAILSRSAETPYDLVLVISNEGRSLGQFFSGLDSGKKPVSGVVIMELHDHGFHMYYDRPFSWLRLALWPVYLIVNLFERMRFEQFDIVLANSQWTATNFEYLYGIPVFMPTPNVDYDFFSSTDYVVQDEKFIAFPTVSLNDALKKLGQRLYSDGINLISYGPKKVEGIPYKGFIPENELPQFLSKATATLFLFDYEALGLVPLESLASGTPVITQPKQGPYSELKGNKFVKFADDFETIKKYCEEYLSNPKSRDVFEGCKESVYPLSTNYSCEVLMEKLGALKSSS